MTELPDHLGGHMNKTHVDRGALQFFMTDLGCETMLDVGCGPGGQVELAISMGYRDVLGLDGDYTLDRTGLQGEYRTIDFTKEKFSTKDHDRTWDLGWSCEFVEHVPEEFIPNYMAAFEKCIWVCMTYCPPQPTKNPHHFNEQPEKYWLEVFEDYGFFHDEMLTRMVRGVSTQKKPFVQTRGLVFRNDQL